MSIYEIFRKALETENYDLLDKIMDNNCTYISKENKKYGKKEIINFLYNTYNSHQIKIFSIENIIFQDQKE